MQRMKIFLPLAFATSCSLAHNIPASPIKSPLSFAPSELTAHATNINSPEDFRPFEPLLAAASGIIPLSPKSIIITDKDTVHTSCNWFNAAGCYLPVEDKIYVASQKSDIVLRSFSDKGEKCSAPESSFVDAQVLATYIHEQGHYLEPSFSEGGDFKSWINELRAQAFEFYFWEFTARYDRTLALSMLIPLTNVNTGAFPQNIERAVSLVETPHHSLAFESIFTLLASGFDSYHDLWVYVNSHTSKEIVARIKETDQKNDYHSYWMGRQRAKDRFFEIAGVQRVKLDVNVNALNFHFGQFKGSDFSYLEVFPTYTDMKYSMDFENARVQIHYQVSKNSYFRSPFYVKITITTSDDLSFIAESTGESNSHRYFATYKVSDSVGDLIRREYNPSGESKIPTVTIQANTFSLNPSFCDTDERDDSDNYKRYDRFVRSLLLGLTESIGEKVVSIPNHPFGLCHTHNSEQERFQSHYISTANLPTTVFQTKKFTHEAVKAFISSL